jgi:hypothetical protein
MHVRVHSNTPKFSLFVPLTAIGGSRSAARGDISARRSADARNADEWALEAERCIDRGETPSSRGRIDPTMTTDRFAARLQSKTACSLISDCPPD